MKYHKEELDGLSNLIIDLHKTSKLRHVDNDILISELERLLKREVCALCLEVAFHMRYYISLFHLGDKVEIQFVKSDVNERMRRVGKQTMLYLGGLGFQPSLGHAWTLDLNLKEASINHIMTLISRICFDVIQTDKSASCRLMSVESQ